MFKPLLLALVAMGFISISAWAQDSAEDASTPAGGTTGAALEDMATEQPEDRSLDEEITNKRLRAESGSTSRWSMSIEGGYSGGSIDDPFSSTRPNYRRGLGEDAVGASVDIKGRFRIDPKTSIALASGVSIIQPFHGGLETTEALDDATSVNTPYLSLARYYAAGGFQMGTSTSFYYYTAESRTIEGYQWTLGFSQNVQRAFFDNRLTIGTTVIGNYHSADRSMDQLTKFNAYRTRHGTRELSRSEYLARISEYELIIVPYAEYTLTDMLSLRTEFGYFNFEMASNQSTFDQSEPFQSIGVAISPTRNIYLYPNIQFTPEDITTDRTNVAISTIINLF